jgi:anti-sigma B factor antagonist
MAEEKQSMRITEQGGATVVVLEDQKILDEINIQSIGQRLGQIVAEASVPRLVIDFRNVTNMSSSALGMLITLHKRIREANGQLRLCNIQPNIAEVFQITRLNEIFQICENQEEAIQSVTA